MPISDPNQPAPSTADTALSLAEISRRMRAGMPLHTSSAAEQQAAMRDPAQINAAGVAASQQVEANRAALAEERRKAEEEAKGAGGGGMGDMSAMTDMMGGMGGAGI